MDVLFLDAMRMRIWDVLNYHFNTERFPNHRFSENETQRAWKRPRQVICTECRIVDCRYINEV